MYTHVGNTHTHVTLYDLVDQLFLWNVFKYVHIDMTTPRMPWLIYGTKLNKVYRYIHAGTE